MIRNVKLHINGSKDSIESAKLAKRKLESNYFNVTDENYDLAMAIGGDGTFLKMVRDEDFNPNIYYVGVNAGHLGFLQEAKIEDLDELLDEIKNEKYKVSNTDVQETLVKHVDGETLLYSLNDIVISDVMHSKTFKADVYRHDGFLEVFAGTAIILATSLGSTGYSKAAGGCLVSSDFSTIQFTPLAPNDSSAYRSLSNSVIESDKGYFKILPYNTNITVCYDCEEANFKEADTIVSRISDKKIKRLCFSHYSYAQRINEKFLK